MVWRSPTYSNDDILSTTIHQVTTKTSLLKPSLCFASIPLPSEQPLTYPMAATVYTSAVAPITDFEVVTQRKVQYEHVFLLHPCPPSMFLLSVSFFAHYIFLFLVTLRMQYQL
jgi:hypothetical protein